MNIKRDENRMPTLCGVSSADGVTILPVKVNPTTKRLLCLYKPLGTNIAPLSPLKRDENRRTVLGGKRSDTGAVVGVRVSTNGLLVQGA